MKKLLAILLAFVLVIGLMGCSGAQKDTIVIGGKNFTEQDILVNIMKILIENKTNLKVETKPYLGGTFVVAKALEKGELDLYAEYTGTALITLLHMETIKDPETAYNTVKKEYLEQKNLVWLEPFGFNNTYTLALRADKAEELGIETYSDLVKHAPELTLGATQEFLERDDGYKGLTKVYGMTFKDAKGMDAGLIYAAARDRKVDVINAFATDGRIPAFNLKVLKDDKQFFPPYYAAPVIRKDTLDKHPEIGETLKLLAGRLDDKKMAELNSKVDIEGQDAKKVAEDWLKAEGLIN